MRILLIEDDAEYARAMTAICEQAGHEVFNIIGFGRRRMSSLIGITRDMQEVPLTLTDFNLALVDGKLAKNEISGRDQWGWDYTPYIVDEGVPCIGVSSEDTMNKYIVKAGAHAFVNKSDLHKKLLATINEVKRSKTVAVIDKPDLHVMPKARAQEIVREHRHPASKMSVPQPAPTKSINSDRVFIYLEGHNGFAYTAVRFATNCQLPVGGIEQIARTILGWDRIGVDYTKFVQAMKQRGYKCRHLETYPTVKATDQPPSTPEGIEVVRGPVGNY